MTDPDAPDGALLQRARNGDRAAAEALLVRWLPGLRDFVRHRMSPLLRGREATDDVVQSTCREVIAGLDRCEDRGDEAFRGWLFTAVLHKVQKRERDARAQRRDPRREVPLAETPTTAQPPAVQPTPSAEASANEQRARLAAAIAELPPDQRQVLALARLEHLPRDEIARQLGRSEAAVRSLLTRALKALGERLADGGPSAG
jgi:RNA polymerase sigma-70 factor (ECF subfamily)